MRRARGVAVAAALGVAAVGVVAGATAVFAPAGQGDQVFAGRFAPDAPVGILNKTVIDGRYLVRYSMSIYVVADDLRDPLTCSVVDTSGRIASLPGLVRTVPVGRWVFVDGQDVFELPDVTLGIRCAPQTSTVIEMLVRDARIEATKLD